MRAQGLHRVHGAIVSVCMGCDAQAGRDTECSGGEAVGTVKQGVFQEAEHALAGSERCRDESALGP